MKKKIAIMILAGVMTLNVCACGQKNANSDNTTEVSSEAKSDVEDKDSSKEEKVSDRADYVSMEEINITEYVKLPDYENMTIEVNKPLVSDAQIEEYIDANLLEGMIKNRAVKEGDTANIDYVGKKDGVAFQGGTAQGYNLSIGSGTFIPGFEEGLVGVMPGETKDLEISFPEDYVNTELAGQPVVFTVTVNGIVESANYATVTEEQMAEMGIAYKTKEEVWEAGKEAVQKSADDSFDASVLSEIQTKINEETVFLKDAPEYFVEEEVQNYKNYLEKMYENYYQKSMEDALKEQNMTIEEFDEQLTEGVALTVKSYMIIEALSRKEGITLSKEEILKLADEEAFQYGYTSGNDFIEDVGYTSYRMSVLSEKVMDSIKNKINVVAVDIEVNENEETTEIAD
ncbi:MAG: FKBP-type peptidyl-prolyl cis-trans isomerase [Lachnospiraceae bacterium]|nr:FKBP-type peptidyl-prolyl cis-trans isomerase [Lachnospiraceae bacterium]